MPVLTAAQTHPVSPGSTILALPGPLNAPLSLAFFQRAGDDGLDRWDGRTLLRTVRADATVVAFAATFGGTIKKPFAELAIEGGDTYRDQVQRAVVGYFAPRPTTLGDLLMEDPVLAEIERRYPGLRQVLQPDLFTALVRCITAQQVNLQWASLTRRRLADRYGVVHHLGDYVVYHLEPARLAAATVDDLRDLQFSTRKSEYLIGAAEAIVSGALESEALATLEDDEVVARLVSVRGIGLWTAEWILARTLGRPRVVAGDLAVRKAVGLAYEAGPAPSEAEVRRLTAHWGAAASFAQLLVLENSLAQSNRARGTRLLSPVGPRLVRP